MTYKLDHQKIIELYKTAYSTNAGFIEKPYTIRKIKDHSFSIVDENYDTQSQIVSFIMYNEHDVTILCSEHEVRCYKSISIFEEKNKSEEQLFQDNLVLDRTEIFFRQLLRLINI